MYHIGLITYETKITIVGGDFILAERMGKWKIQTSSNLAKPTFRSNHLEWYYQPLDFGRRS